MKDVNAAADPLGLQIEVLKASNGDEIDAAFASLVSGRVAGLLVGADAFFVSRRVQIAILAVRYMIPAIYTVGEYAEAGGLISYGMRLPIRFASKVFTLDGFSREPSRRTCQ